MITLLDVLTVIALWIALAVGYATVHLNLGAMKRGIDVGPARKALSAVSLLAGASVVVFAFIYTEAWIVVLSILTTSFLAAYSVGDMADASFRRWMPRLPAAELASVAVAVLAWLFLRW